MKFKREDFKYIQNDEPLLVLAVKVNPDYYGEYKFTNKRDFVKIAHQTAGIGCHQHYMVGTILKPKWHILANMQTLTAKWLDSCAGVMGVHLNDVVAYREDLKRFFQMDCNLSYRDFEEAIYPIDCTTENLKVLTDEQLPENLDDLIVFSDDMQRFIGSIGRWSLYILGPNCD